MSTDFPKYTRSARLGEQGVNIVTGIVSDAFGGYLNEITKNMTSESMDKLKS